MNILETLKDGLVGLGNTLVLVGTEILSYLTYFLVLFAGIAIGIGGLVTVVGLHQQGLF
jgi:hypothetical protein